MRPYHSFSTNLITLLYYTYYVLDIYHVFLSLMLYMISIEKSPLNSAGLDNAICQPKSLLGCAFLKECKVVLLLLLE